MNTDYALAHAIMRTITYYDVMDFPMTSFEIWRHLITQDANTRWSYGQVLGMLTAAEVSEYVSSSDGFYFLDGRERLVKERSKRERISHSKTKKLHFYVGFLRFVPFVRCVAMTGRLAMKNAEHSSDLDVMIILKDGHIWLGRIFVTGFLHVAGMRRHGRKQSDRICLNYYVSDGSLTVPTQDLFGAHEYSFIVPMVGRATFAEFLMANRWIRNYRSNYMADYVGNAWMHGENVCARTTQKIGEFIFQSASLENLARQLQREKILKNPMTALPGALIIADDKHLVFLPKPHGPHVYEKYRKRLNALELPWPSSV